MDEQYLKAIVFYRYYLKNRIYFLTSFIEGKAIALVSHYHIVHFTPILISCNFMAIVTLQSAIQSVHGTESPLMFLSIVSNVIIYMYLRR